MFYFNGIPAKSTIKTSIQTPIKYIGNSKDKSEPFGVICDLRIYAYILDPEIIKNMSLYNEKQGFFFYFLICTIFLKIYKVDNFPDKICEIIKNSKGIEELLNALRNPFCEAQTEVCRALSALATKSFFKCF